MRYMCHYHPVPDILPRVHTGLQTKVWSSINDRRMLRLLEEASCRENSRHNAPYWGRYLSHALQVQSFIWVENYRDSSLNVYLPLCRSYLFLVFSTIIIYFLPKQQNHVLSHFIHKRKVNRPAS